MRTPLFHDSSSTEYYNTAPNESSAQSTNHESRITLLHESTVLCLITSHHTNERTNYTAQSAVEVLCTLNKPILAGNEDENEGACLHQDPRCALIVPLSYLVEKLVIFLCDRLSRRSCTYRTAVQHRPAAEISRIYIRTRVSRHLRDYEYPVPLPLVANLYLYLHSLVQTTFPSSAAPQPTPSYAKADRKLQSLLRKTSSTQPSKVRARVFLAVTGTGVQSREMCNSTRLDATRRDSVGLDGTGLGTIVSSGEVRINRYYTRLRGLPNRELCVAIVQRSGDV